MTTHQDYYARNNYMYNENYAMPDRQFDIGRVGNYHTTLPLAVPYRMDATDFVFFNFPTNFPVRNYHVLVESISTASSEPMDRYRDIGPLEHKVELPNVYFSKGFDSHARIGVIPVNGNGPSFLGNLVRGSTYTIDLNADVITPQGHRALQRTGVY